MFYRKNYLTLKINYLYLIREKLSYLYIFRVTMSYFDGIYWNYFFGNFVRIYQCDYGNPFLQQ